MVVHGAPAAAQEEDPAAAALFQEGRALIKKGDWATGCERIEASTKRQATVSALLNLALCREHAGRVATAFAIVQRALVLNRETQGKQRREELEASANEILGRLGPRVPKLRLSLTERVEGARIEEAGLEIPLDVAVPLDPGDHELVLSAPGKTSVTRRVQLREGENLAIELVFPAAPSNPPPGPTEPAGRTPPAKAPPPDAEVSSGAAIPIWVWFVGGAGAVLGGFSIAFAVDAANAASFLEDRCGEDLVCDEDPSFDPEPENARKNRGLGLAVGLGIGGVAGLVAAIAGAAVAAGSAPAKKSALVDLGLWCGPEGIGAGVSGRF